jgi:hypothetical protein
VKKPYFAVFSHLRCSIEIPQLSSKQPLELVFYDVRRESVISSTFGGCGPRHEAAMLLA